MRTVLWCFQRHDNGTGPGVEPGPAHSRQHCRFRRHAGPAPGRGPVTRWQLLRAGNRESGLSLVELLVSIVLLGVLLTMTSGLYISATRSLDQAKSLGSNTRQVSNGMNEVARVIRAATANPVAGHPLTDPALEQATAEALTLYAYVNLGMSAQRPVKIQLAVDADRRLIETRWASIALAGGFFTFETTPQSTRIVAETVAPSRTALFRYLDSAGVPVASAGAFTATELRSIAAISVNLTVQASVTDSRSAVTLQNTVGMPNVALAARP
ncbi:prepilin-type N-terminal cleavage/methylation domain-containing protein [Cryobacterium sp. TMT1-2-2]|nr:prepilin-type N-terminal cleavage/methylation domain-containing protein [Cryobacterium sp. TMT1-66-1]TFD11250.1 prepilin-type N-terminal cleavage/methylation domain-containing protein [Cryobacterium sp. TMT1-2-2]